MGGYADVADRATNHDPHKDIVTTSRCSSICTRAATWRRDWYLRNGGVPTYGNTMAIWAADPHNQKLLEAGVTALDGSVPDPPQPGAPPDRPRSRPRPSPGLVPRPSPGRALRPRRVGGLLGQRHLAGRATVRRIRIARPIGPPPAALRGNRMPNGSPSSGDRAQQQARARSQCVGGEAPIGVLQIVDEFGDDERVAPVACRAQAIGERFVQGGVVEQFGVVDDDHVVVAFADRAAEVLLAGFRVQSAEDASGTRQVPQRRAPRRDQDGRGARPSRESAIVTSAVERPERGGPATTNPGPQLSEVHAEPEPDSSPPTPSERPRAATAGELGVQGGQSPAP